MTFSGPFRIIRVDFKKDVDIVITSKKTIRQFVLLCSFIYFVSYVTRTNYGAVLSEMVTSMGLEKSRLSVALTGSFITYGAGQLVSGFLGDRIHPKKLLACGLLATVLMNVCIPLCSSASVMAAVWCVNGFAQAFMWPPLVKTMMMLLSEEDYKTNVIYVSFGSSFGSVFVYLIAPLLIYLASWKTVFLFCAAIGLVGLLLWLRNCPDFPLSSPQKATAHAEKATNGSLFSVLLVLAVLAIMLQCILKDGVITYMPSFIAETYHLSNEVSILSGVLLPLFSVVTTKLAEIIHKKYIKNLMLCAAVFYLFGTAAAAALSLFHGTAPALSVLLLMLITGSTYGVNLMIVSYLPAQLGGKEHMSTMAGLINACAYMGAAVSTYIIPLAAETAGWGMTLNIWLFSSVIGTVLCLIGVPLSKKKMHP